MREQGLPLLAHVLRRLSDRFVDAALEWDDRGLLSPPRTSSTLLLVEEEGPVPVTAMAARLRQSHPLVITWIRQLAALGFVSTSPARDDRRKTLVSITPAGRLEADRVRRVWRIYGDAYAGLSDELGVDLLELIWRAHDALDQNPFVDRLRVAASQHSTSNPGD